MKKITAIIALATVFIACNEARETEETLVVEETAPTQVVHPEWSKNANIYEVNAKWGEFKSGILNDYEIELVEGTAMAISKENKHKQVKLADLVGKDETLSKLVLGRQQSGVNAREINSVEIDGVPFKVPENADSAVRTQVIKDYLLNVKKLNPTSAWRRQSVFSSRAALCFLRVRAGQHAWRG